MIKIASERREPLADTSPLLTEEEAAALLRITPAKLRRLRYDKRGPKTVKIGGDHRIRHAALMQWMADREE